VTAPGTSNSISARKVATDLVKRVNSKQNYGSEKISLKCLKEKVGTNTPREAKVLASQDRKTARKENERPLEVENENVAPLTGLYLQISFFPFLLTLLLYI